MARSTTTFDSGNRVGQKLTPETHELFVNTLRVTGRLSVAAARCCIGGTTAREWLRRGAREESGIYREFLDACETARAEFLVLASRRLSQLAVGGVVQLPAYDKKTGAPLRNHREDCPAIPSANCGCELIVTERVLLPNAQALMFQLDRSDPQPNLETPQPDVPVPPELTDAEAIAEAGRYYDLFAEAFRLMNELGMLMLAAWKTIEASSTKVEAEPAKEITVARDDSDPTEQASPETRATETPTEPEPGRPKFEDAF
jgi:hypothetical protein